MAKPLRRLSELFTAPLRIRLDGRDLKFASVGGFDFCIAARTAVPAFTINDLYLRREAELDAEIISLGGLERQIDGILADYLEHGKSLIGALGAHGIERISKDNGWRSIFEQLSTSARCDDGYVRAALCRYLEYLAQRRAVLGSISLLKTKFGADPEVATRPFTQISARNAMGGGAAQSDPLRRLPHGHPFVVKLARGSQMDINLAHCHFSLNHDSEWTLVADDGQRHVLRSGINSVGRSRENTIALDSGSHDISRKHLLAEPVGENAIVLTDISSGGTFVSPSAISV